MNRIKNRGGIRWQCHRCEDKSDPVMPDLSLHQGGVPPMPEGWAFLRMGQDGLSPVILSQRLEPVSVVLCLGCTRAVVREIDADITRAAN